MMTRSPNYIVTTGDFIAEWMETEGVNAAELSRRLGVTPKHVSELLSGIAPLSHRLALALERVTGVPARIWNQYESGYRGDLARTAEAADLEAQGERARSFPLTYLRKFGFITTPARDTVGTVRQLLAILGVASFAAFDETWTKGNVAYRRSAVGRDDTPKLATWLALAERHHDQLADLPSFDRAKLRELIPELRSLTAVEDAANAVNDAIARLRGVGVVLCLIPAVPGLGIYGATRWVNARPIIQLSLHGKSDDQLWFTVFHELGHVLLHGDKALYLNGEKNAVESEADTFATDVLVPPEYAVRLPLGRNIAAVTALAQELGIAPSIVLGSAQHRTRDYAWGHALKRTFEWRVNIARMPAGGTG
jgi:HTH-type transcriptional regulator/antitoxin HigA